MVLKHHCFTFRYTGKENLQPKPVLEKVNETKNDEMPEEEMEVEELAVAFSTQRLNVEDIDSQDSNNPQLVSEYVCDIYNYLRTLEVTLSFSLAVIN